MDAYLNGLEQAKEASRDLSQVHSVASFFVSRVDLEIDKRLKAIGSDEAATLKGQAAIANPAGPPGLRADLHRGTLGRPGRRRRQQAAPALGVHRGQGSQVRRHPVRRRTCGPEHGEYRPRKDHPGRSRSRGDPRQHHPGTYDQAAQVFSSLQALGIDLEDVFQILETEAVDKFEKAWEELLESVSTELQARQ